MKERKGTASIYGVPVGANYDDYTTNYKKMLQIMNVSSNTNLSHNVAWTGLEPKSAELYTECLWAETGKTAGLHLFARNAIKDSVTLLARWVPPPEGPSEIRVAWNLESDRVLSPLPTTVHMNTEERVVVRRPAKDAFIVVIDNKAGRNDDIVVTAYEPPPGRPRPKPAFVEKLKTETIGANCGAMGGNQCSGTPTVDKCLTVDGSGNDFLVETANIKDPVIEGEGAVWITEPRSPKKICARANANLAPGGRSSRVSGTIVVMQRVWQADADDELWRYVPD